MKIVWTDPAKADVRSIHAHIAIDSKLYAKRTVERIKRAAARLRRFPDLGERVEEWNNPELRELIVGAYRLIYRRRDVVQILAVLHGARRLPDPSSLPEGNGHDS